MIMKKIAKTIDDYKNDKKYANIDFDACTPEFFEKHIDKIPHPGKGNYKYWLGLIPMFKAVGISKEVVNAWCRMYDGTDNMASVDGIWYKNDDPYESMCRFCKLAGIKLPAKHREAADVKFDIKEVMANAVVDDIFFIRTVEKGEFKVSHLDIDNIQPDYERCLNALRKIYKPNESIIWQFGSTRKVMLNEGVPGWENFTIKDLEKQAQLCVRYGKGWEDGVKIKINPYDAEQAIFDASEAEDPGKHKWTDDYVKRFDNTLVECDELTLDEQMALIRYTKIPYKLIVYSGGKSLHVVVDLHAGTSRQKFNDRRAMLERWMKAHLFPFDTSTKNPGREFRAPGFIRIKNGKETVQQIVSDGSDSEFKSWEEFEEYIKPRIYINDGNKPKISSIVDKNDEASKNIKDIFKHGENYYIARYSYSNSPFTTYRSKSNFIEDAKLYLNKDEVDKIVSRKDDKHKFLEFNDFNWKENDKEIVSKITIEKSDDVFNLFEPGLIIEALKNRKEVKEIPPEIDKLLDNLADEKCKKWLINHMSVWLNAYVVGFNKFAKENGLGSKWKLQTIPCLIGGQRTGKNTLMNDIFGEIVQKDKPLELSLDNIRSGGFNSGLKQAVQVLAELPKYESEKKMLNSTLKLWQAPTIMINEKYLPEYNIDNVSYKVITDNTNASKSNLNIDTDDARIQYIEGGKNVNAVNIRLCDMTKLFNERIDFANFLLSYKYDVHYAATVFSTATKISDMSQSIGSVDEVILDFYYDYEDQFEYIQASMIMQYIDERPKQSYGSNVRKSDVTKRFRTLFGEPRRHNTHSKFNNNVSPSSILCLRNEYTWDFNKEAMKKMPGYEGFEDFQYEAAPENEKEENTDRIDIFDEE